MTLKGYKDRGPSHRSSVGQTLDVLMRHGDFDPLATLDLTYSEPEEQGFDLDCGLPFQNLKYALQQDSYISDVRSRVIFIYTNTIQIRMSELDALECVEYLCTEYELARRRWPEDTIWNDVFPLLWICLPRSEYYHKNELGHEAKLAAQKISLILRLSNDLDRTLEDGRTALDVFLLGYSDAARPWLSFLADNDINPHDYCRREQDLHPDGYLNPGVPCCTLFALSVIYGASENDVTIKVVAERDPRFYHLDPNFLCKGLFSRRLSCLAESDDIMIGNDGRPCCGIPGAWEDRIMPNSDLIWVKLWIGHYWGFDSISEIPKPYCEIVDYHDVQNAVKEEISINSLEAIQQCSNLWRSPVSGLDDSDLDDSDLHESNVHDSPQN